MTNLRDKSLKYNDRSIIMTRSYQSSSETATIVIGQAPLFALLTWLGMCHAEEPYITLGICASLFYFGYFLVLIPLIGLVENTLADVGLDRSKV